MDFLFLDSKITVDGDWSHERCLLLGRKAVTKLDSILKSRDIILTTKAQAIKTIIFPVVLYRCESWTIKKAEQQRTDVFKLQCWIRHLRVSWDVRKSNQSVLKEIFIIRTDAEDEALILWTLDAKSQPTGNDSDAEKDWWQEEKEMTEDEIVWWHRWHNGHDLDSDKEAWHVTRSWYDLMTEHNNNIGDPLPSFHLSPDPFTLWWPLIYVPYLCTFIIYLLTPLFIASNMSKSYIACFSLSGFFH